MHSRFVQVDILEQPIKYDEAIKWFEDKSKDRIFILEHEDIYTAGKSVKERIDNINGIKAINTDRGGLWTWHGKGQIIVYFIYNLHNHKMTLSDFFEKIENIFIELITEEINNKNYIVYADNDKRGFWVKKNKTNSIAKIGFIGLHISKGILTHGISINYNNNLEFFDYINPCGLGDVKITSIQEICNNKELLNIEKFKENIATKLKNNF